MKKLFIIVVCFAYLTSCSKTDDENNAKEIDFSKLKLDTPDSSSVPVDTAIENIVNKLKKKHRKENNLFIADCMTIELPQSFHAELLINQEKGDSYYIVKNSKDSVVMHFDFGLQSRTGLGKKIDVESLTKDFVLDTKKDTDIEGQDKILKLQTVVMQAKRRINAKYYPYVVDFVCRLDLVEPFTCEKIISSATTIHDCLDRID